MSQVTEADYREAQNGDAKVRQQFCDAVDLEDSAEFVSEVRYFVPEKELEKTEWGLLPLMSHSGRHTTKSPEGKEVAGCRYLHTTINVFPTAFETLSFEEFLSSKIDHEGGQHARQFRKSTDVYVARANKYYHPDEDIRLYNQSILELPAYANQLVRAERRGLSEEIKNSVGERMMQYAHLLEKYSFDKVNYDLIWVGTGSEGDQYVKELMGLKIPWNWI